MKKQTKKLTIILDNNVHLIFSEKNLEITLCEENFLFSLLQPIEPERDDQDRILELFPQFNYQNKKNLETHCYGNGPFCRFKINADPQPGVYLWVVDHTIIYIGETNNLKKRFNTGYGNISPRNCFKGGQTTNCKMNQVVLKMAKENKYVNLYFYKTDKYKDVEKELLKSINTEYNKKNNI